MYKTLLAVAVGAIAFTGCDFSEAAEPAAASNVAAIEVSGLPNSAWDADGGPDVFVELRTPSGRAFYRSEPVMDADVSETLTFDLDGVSVGSPTQPLLVAVFDLDENLVVSQEMSSTTSFTAQDLEAGDLTPEATRGSIVVRSSVAQ